jgi:hypothetical protein
MTLNCTFLFIAIYSILNEQKSHGNLLHYMRFQDIFVDALRSVADPIDETRSVFNSIRFYCILEGS